ncbi:MAG: hypothetical protein AAFW87_02395 [Pseudomonadota bacterium]
MSSAEEIIRDLLGSGLIKEVRVEPDQSRDGDEIVRILVVYDERVGEISPDEMTSVTDKIWSVFSRDEGRGFPITSFMSSADAKEFQAA